VGDDLEEAIVAGAIAALRRRADRQRAIAKAHGPGSGEAAIALRIAETLDRTADELEAEAQS
jgi:hypothetical protein